MKTMQKPATKAVAKVPEPFHQVLRFNLRSNTSGAHRYDEVDENGNVVKTNHPRCVIGGLYVRKTAVTGSVPQNLVVTLTEG